MQEALRASIDRGVPVGGTSAGLNLLTTFIYPAEGPQGATSEQALADPFHPSITLRRDFVSIPLLAGILGDSHFRSRDRMGRDLALLCRIASKGWAARPRAIAVDEDTALLVDEKGRAVVVGAGSVYFLVAPGAPEVCAPRTPLTYRAIEVYRLGPAGEFDLPGWRGQGGAAYQVSAQGGALTSTQVGGAVY